jgi:hypothetical protein
LAENLRRFALLGAALLLAGCATTEFGPHAAETYCATLAVVEQESTCQADPAASMR